METLLQMEYNDPNYKADLNYEWCGDIANVVFCGDFLDNVRGAIDKKPGEYPFEEARVFMFINAINKQAKQKRSEAELHSDR